MSPTSASHGWMRQGNCARRENDVNMTPDQGATEAITLAKSVCDGTDQQYGPCPVAEQCLAWATDFGVTDGIWAGLTSDEVTAARRSQRRRESKQRCAARDQAETPVTV